MEAESAAYVADRLRMQGYIPTSIEPARKGVAAALTQPIGGSKAEPAQKLTLVQLTVLSRQLATMIQGGVPLVQSLAILSQQFEDKRVAALVNEVRQSVESGESLAATLAKHPKAFPNIFVHMVEAGEASGTLDVVLGRVADHFESEVALRGKIKGALMYPMILLGVAALAVTALMLFVLPTFIDMFESMGAELPWLTAALFGFGKSVQHYWYIYLGVPLMGGALFVSYIRGPGAAWWDRTLLKVKIIGPLIQKTQTAQFSRTFGMLVQSGVPMLQALDILDRLSDNSVVRETLKEAKSSVRDGVGLSRPLRQSKIFPPMLSHMVGVGEETGALDEMLRKTADFYDREVDQAVKNLTTAIEPLIMLVIGVIAAFIVAAIMIPMFNMSNAFL
ncbi:MAG: type II secretion system F family protein [Bacillota bacterium]|jgi:type IV pilus assembly protein PilC